MVTRSHSKAEIITIQWATDSDAETIEAHQLAREYFSQGWKTLQGTHYSEDGNAFQIKLIIESESSDYSRH